MDATVKMIGIMLIYTSIPSKHYPSMFLLASVGGDVDVCYCFQFSRSIGRRKMEIEK